MRLLILERVVHVFIYIHVHVACSSVVIGTCTHGPVIVSQCVCA